MNESINSGGGFAFPVPSDAHVNGQEGMSLLYYFAGQALANSVIAYSGLDEDEIAVICKSQAIAMLKALERRNATNS